MNEKGSCLCAPRVWMGHVLMFRVSERVCFTVIEIRAAALLCVDI